MNYVNLHVHSEYSILDGMSRVEEIVDKAAKLGQEAVAITDHGHMGSVPEFYKYAKEKGVKPIIGQEFYIVDNASERDKDEERLHLIMLALNREGYQILCRLSSEASEHFYYKPRIDRKMLRRYHSWYENVAVLSGCMSGELPRAILADDNKKARGTIQFYNTFFPNYYLEFQYHGYKPKKIDASETEFRKNEEKINSALWKYHKQYKIPVVVAADSHYTSRNDRKDHEVLLAMQTGTDMDNPKRFRFNGRGYHFPRSKRNEEEDSI